MPVPTGGRAPTCVMLSIQGRHEHSVDFPIVTSILSELSCYILTVAIET